MHCTFVSGLRRQIGNNDLRSCTLGPGPTSLHPTVRLTLDDCKSLEASSYTSVIRPIVKVEGQEQTFPRLTRLLSRSAYRERDGVLDFVGADQDNYCKSFGRQWNTFREVQLDSVSLTSA